MTWPQVKGPAYRMLNAKPLKDGAEPCRGSTPMAIEEGDILNLPIPSFRMISTQAPTSYRNTP